MSKSKLPIYVDGAFHLFKIANSDDLYPRQFLIDTHMDVCFQELSIFDKLKYELSSAGTAITGKIRIPQYREITPDYVLKIGNEYHRVYNAAHFTNSEGYKQTDITMEKWAGCTEVDDDKQE